LATMTPGDDDESFRRTLDAFDGARYPLDVGSSKVLRFMLARPDGCDATVSPSRFEIRFGWHPARHRYVLRAAPPVVSELFRLADATPAPSVRARIGPGTISIAGTVSWSFGPRWLWMDASDTAASIRVRDATSRAGKPTDLEPLPEPIKYPRRFVDLAPPLPCPHCTTPAHRYRQLHDGSLVCPTCSRSFVQTPK
jgi:hypothetical protein